MDKHNRIFNRFREIGLIGYIPFILTYTAVLVWLFIIPVQYFSDSYSTIILDSEGTLLGAAISDDEQWRFPPGQDIPERLKKAIITFEDKRFYGHFGFDVIATGRALRDNIRGNGIISGGSTITMQVIRLSRKGKPRTIKEKVIEFFGALKLEAGKSKDEILLMFASRAPFGGNVVGVEAAAWRYFGRDVFNLSWAECALLAILPNSPSLINLGRNRDLLKSKRDRLLHRMYKKGQFDLDTYFLAVSEPVPLKPKPLPNGASHLLDSVLLGYADTKQESTIKTTINGDLQKNVNSILYNHGQRLLLMGINNAAVLVIDNRSAEAVVYAANIPGLDIEQKYVDMIKAARSTGSTLKPFLYGAMIETGELFPTQLIPDYPVSIGGYRPENHTHTFSGAVSAEQALSTSLNVPAAVLLRDFGVSRFYDLLKEHKFSTLFRKPEMYGIAMILGGVEGTLWDISSIYANLTRSVAKDESVWQDIRIFDDQKPEPEYDRKLISPQAWWITMNALKKLNRPKEMASWSFYESSKEIAWKTGTSYGFRDAWAIGVTADFTVGVWVGNADGEGRPGLQGSKAAAPILFDVFAILPETSYLNIPNEMPEARICSVSGYLAGSVCNKTESIRLPSTGRAGTVCPYHKVLHLDENGKYQVDSTIMRVDEMRRENWFVLPPLMEWYYKRTHSDYQVIPPLHPELRESRNEFSFSILFPQKNINVYLPVDIDGTLVPLAAEAFSLHPDAILYWHLDDEYLGATSDIHQMEIRPKEGRHRLVIVDNNGAVKEVSFKVLSK